MVKSLSIEGEYFCYTSNYPLAKLQPKAKFKKLLCNDAFVIDLSS